MGKYETEKTLILVHFMHSFLQTNMIIAWSGFCEGFTEALPKLS